MSTLTTNIPINAYSLEEAFSHSYDFFLSSVREEVCTLRIPDIFNFQKPYSSCFVEMLNVKLNRKSLYLGFYQAG